MTKLTQSNVRGDHAREPVISRQTVSAGVNQSIISCVCHKLNDIRVTLRQQPQRINCGIMFHTQEGAAAARLDC